MNSSHCENIILKWDKLCRICLNDESISSPVNKLEAIDEQHKLSFCDMLNICSGIHYSLQDPFPQLICSLCITHMYNALEFRKKCESSKNLLAKLIHRKEGLNTPLQCDDSDAETDIYCEIDDPTKSIEVTDFLKVDYTSISDKNETKNLNDNQEPVFSKAPENAYSKNVNLTNMDICSICQTSYNSVIKLSAYKKLNPNACWQCNINLNTVKECNEHLKVRPKESVKRQKVIHAKDKYLCTICGEKLCSTSALNAHIRIHNGEKRYECIYCGKKFLHWSVRRYHVRSAHTLERPYACEICDKRYIDKAKLVLHIRNHTGEKPFQCSVCSMRFKGRERLREHMYTHTGQKRKYCELCNKSFSNNSNLKLHMKKHTRERKHELVVA